MQTFNSTMEQVGTEQKTGKRDDVKIWLQNKTGGVNVFITRSFIKTATTHALKITEF